MTPDQDAKLRDILGRTRVIAVVGISPKHDRPSFRVAEFLQAHGYKIVPVNPGHAGETILGEPVWADLASLPAELDVDMLDIFRRSEMVPEVVEEGLRHLPKLRTVWMQIGVQNREAAEVAQARGLDVVQDRCPKIEYARLMSGA
jgi:predicted CoA-binding protein